MNRDLPDPTSPERSSPEQLEELLQRAEDFVRASLDPLRSVRLQGNIPVRILWPLAAAARCRRLVEAMLSLRDQRLTDVIGIIARTHFETWATGMYVLHAGETAVQEVADDFKHWLHHLMEQLGTPHPPAVPPWLNAAEPKKLSTDALARKLAKHLADEDHPAKDYPVPAYQRLFGGESLFSSHGRVGAWLQHIKGQPDADLMTIQAVVDDAGPLPLERITEAAALAATLAVESLDRAEVPVGEDLLSAARSLGSPWYPSGSPQQTG